MTRFDACLAFVLRAEGGFVDDARDPGGTTNMGITHRTLAYWRGGPVTVEDVRELTEREARAIYRANYWNPVRGDDLPPGVDLCVFDASVHHGPGTAVRLLQAAVGVERDGAIGPVTLGAVAHRDPITLAQAVNGLRLDRMRGLDTWQTYARGFTNRMNKLHAEVMALTPAAPAPAVSNAPWWQSIVEKVLAWLLSK